MKCSYICCVLFLFSVFFTFHSFGMDVSKTVEMWSKNKVLNLTTGDITYVQNLGVLSRNNRKLEIANPIYQKILSLIIFDRNAKHSWSKKIFTKKEHVEGKKVIVWGC